MPDHDGVDDFTAQQNAAADRFVYPRNQWAEKKPGGRRRGKWILAGVIFAVIAFLAVGISVGIVVTNKNHKSSSTNPGSSTGPGSSSGPSPVNQSDPNDPSTFQRDPRLKKSFYGFAYAPEGSQMPCNASLSQVITDIQLLSQLTSRIRLYGADCDQASLVMEAIKQTKVDMKVYLGNYALPNDNNTAYNRQRDILKQVIQTYGTTHIAGLTVGNEFMLNYVTDNGGPDVDVNGPIGNAGAAILTANIQDTRNMLQSMGLAGKIPVGNSDAGAYFNTRVLEAIDYGLSNVHPWFANVLIKDAATWTWDFFETNNVEVAAALPNKPVMYIAETGWPTAETPSKAGQNLDDPSGASEANLQIFLDTFVCQANQNGTKYFFFEYFDEVWKDVTFGGVEGFWGLFYSNRTLKNVVIPDCASP